MKQRSSSRQGMGEMVVSVSDGKNMFQDEDPMAETAAEEEV